ncbi:hypothetical protein WM08_15060 [Burkholderia ubonensis]|uniref:hypothetical protein n=1 Tax=Burkholderia ubonensis TaxID=101571 RepID=UPI00075F9465|nr:hypothetical protein [Burkholderia ubonensis]KWI90175.1 hypothetical protein WM08_15060 [Burkholderia ubonensis]
MNCKAGDLAYITKGANAGCVVEVVELDGVLSEMEGEPFWMVMSRSPVVCTDFWGRDVWATDFSVRDSWLRPIGGVPVTDDISDEVIA